MSVTEFTGMFGALNRAVTWDELCNASKSGGHLLAWAQLERMFSKEDYKGPDLRDLGSQQVIY